MQGYGEGTVTGYAKAMIGVGKHMVHFADGPRDEKLELRRKTSGKLEFLIKDVLSTSYRRKKNVTHRSATLSFPLTKKSCRG